MKKIIKYQVVFGVCFAIFISLNTESILAQTTLKDILKRTTTKETEKTNTGNQPQTGNQDTLRRAFIEEFGKYRQSVYNLMEIHNPKLKVGNTSYGPPADKAGWKQTMTELGEMDAACKSKYAVMTDPPDKISWNELNQLPATWCAIAANRFDYEKKGKALEVTRQSRHFTDEIEGEIRTTENDPEDRISLQTQLMFWETEKWKAEIFTKLKPRFDEFEAEIPDDFLDEYINKGKLIRDKRESAGATRSFTQPPNKDTVMETWVRQQYQKAFPQGQILKIGSEYADWRIFTNRVNIPTSRTKRGWVLIKLPNRPLCQAREGIIKQDYAGGGRYSANKVDSLGYTGILTKCQ